MDEIAKARIETVWRRAKADTSSAFGNIWFYIYDVVVAVAVAYVADIWMLSNVKQTLTVIGGFLAGVVLAYLWFLGNAGWRQRNDLRSLIILTEAAHNKALINAEQKLQKEKRSKLQPDFKLNITKIGRCFMGGNSSIAQPSLKPSIKASDDLMIYVFVEVTNHGSPSHAKLAGITVSIDGREFMGTGVDLLGLKDPIAIDHDFAISPSDLLMLDTGPHTGSHKTELIETGSAAQGWVIVTVAIEKIGIQTAQKVANGNARLKMFLRFTDNMDVSKQVSASL